MSPDDPRHGTYAGYVAHTKIKQPACAVCAIAGRRARKARQLDVVRNGPNRLPLGEDAWQIALLSSPKVLAQHCRLSRQTIFRVRSGGGPEQIVTRRIRVAILTAGWPVTPVGIQRRLRALGCLGWSMRAFSIETGAMSPEGLRDIQRDDVPPYVRQEYARRIRDAYDRLWNSSAGDHRGAVRARNEARRLGWVPPLAWDCIDDPTEDPNVGRPEKRPSAGRPTAHTLEDFDWLVSNGESEETALARLGITRYAIEAARRRSEVA